MRAGMRAAHHGAHCHHTRPKTRLIKERGALPRAFLRDERRTQKGERPRKARPFAN